MTNSPATSGRTPHESPLTMIQGDVFLRKSTARAVMAPQIAVGSPS